MQDIEPVASEFELESAIAELIRENVALLKERSNLIERGLAEIRKRVDRHEMEAFFRTLTEDQAEVHVAATELLMAACRGEAVSTEEVDAILLRFVAVFPNTKGI
jgi:hypothetical protein